MFLSSLRQLGRLSRQLFTPSIFVFAALCLVIAAQAQTTQSYAGRPFIRIAQPNTSDPLAGFYSGLGRSQLVGNSVYFVTMSGGTATGIYNGRGAAFSKIASIGSNLSGVTTVSFHDGFARDTGGNAVVIAAGDSQPDRLFLTDGTTTSILVSTGAVMPNSGGKTVSGFGEPYYANGKVAVIAAHLLPNGGGSDFQGVYRVNAGALEVVSDIATALPGLGVPDGFSSQLGFDGEVVAFWASRGQFSATNGMFMQNSAGAVTKILQTGDVMPGGGTVSGVFSPPVVSAGVVYFFANDTNSKTSLLKYENGTLTVLAKDDDLTPEGGQLRNLSQFGVGVAGGKVFFPALTAAGAGVYLVENGILSTVVKPGVNLGGFVPTSITLQDVADDTLVLDASNFSVRRLVANLAQPAAPVIITNLINQTVAANARVEFSITALGDEPLTYYWYFGGTNFTGVNGNKLVIENAGVGNIGYYYVTVSNAFGTVNSTSGFLGVDVPPTIFVQPTNTTVEVGDQLALIVVANGGQPLSYFWKKNGELVISDSPAAGYFVRTSAQASDAGVYSVTVSNSFGVATSGEVVVTILPPSPNPSFAGGQFISVLEHDTVLPSTGGSAMDTSVMSESAARWYDGKVTFTGQTLNHQQLGVFTWDAGTYTRVIAPDASLGSLGNADGLQFVTAHPGAPLVVRAQQIISGFRQPVGLYELEGNALSVIVDTNSAAANGDGEKYPMFYYDAYQVGDETVFISLVGGSNTIYRAVGNTVTRVLYDKQDLPVLGTTTSQFQGLAHNGTDIVVTAANFTQQNYVLLRINANGEVSKLLAKGDTLPGTTDSIRNFGSAGTDGEAFYFIVYDNSFRVNLVRWQAGVFTRLAGPGMTVEGMGTIQSIETSFPKGAAGKTYFSARVTTPQGARIAILVADDTGIRPVLIANKLDARRVSACYLMDADVDKVIVLVVFNNGLRAIYANVGTEGEEPPLVLEYHRHTGGSILFSVPAGTQLEYAPEITGPWQTSDMPEVNPTGNRFYRLKKVQ